MKTWNEAFDEAARACQLTKSDLKKIGHMGPHEVRVEDRIYLWERMGNRIQVSVNSAIWTVDLDDMIEPIQPDMFSTD